MADVVLCDFYWITHVYRQPEILIEGRYHWQGTSVQIPPTPEHALATFPFTGEL